MEQPTSSNQAGELAVRDLYVQLLGSWNQRDAHSMAGLFSEKGHVVGFDGSVVNGRQEIEAHIGQVFEDHVTASYIGIVREVRFITEEVALLRAVAGMVPPGGKEINAAVNTIQTLMASRQDNRWEIELYQNTPAQFHRRPDLSAALTRELQQLI